MEIIRMVIRYDDHVEVFKSLSEFVEFVRMKAKEVTKEDIPDNLIRLEFSSDYDSSYATIIIKTPQTVEELKDEILKQKAAEERYKAEQHAKELKEYERLKLKFNKT